MIPFLKRSNQSIAPSGRALKKRKTTKYARTTGGRSGNPFAPTSTYRRIQPRRTEIKVRSSLPTTSTSLTSAGNIYPILTQVLLGDEYNERSGRVINLIACAWTVRCDLPAAVAVNVISHYRVIVFSWSDNSVDNVPVVSDILDNSTILSQYAQPTVTQYKIHFDATYAMRATATSAQAVSRYDRGRCTLNLEQDYPAGSDPSCLRNGLFFLFICDTAQTGFITSSKCQTSFHDV